MNIAGTEVCCPVCHDDLSEFSESLECRGCSRRFPVVAGIPDFRVFPDPYIGIDEDRKKGELLAARLEQETFSSLVDFYYGMTSVVPPHHARLYKRGLMSAQARAEAALDFWEHASGAPASGRLLEVGCGTAPLLVAAARRGYQAAGVDIAFRWLVVAKKRLMESGLKIPLLCACAEALPFRRERFDRVAIDSAIEMVADQPRAMKEAHRVLSPDGRLFLATPNRFSLGPDPHLGVPAGGFWPKSLLAAFARRQGAIPPERKLLWAGSLSRLIRKAGFFRTRLMLPQIAEAQLCELGAALRTAAGLYQVAQKMPITRQCLFLIGPLLYATAQKPRLAENR
jgi:ubiquinone/menaquinone biosynthesis C-methylase UbiE